MKKRLIVISGVLAIILNSCVYSLFPIYTEDTIIFKKELIGAWYSRNGNIKLLFESMHDKKKNDVDKEHKYSLKIKEGFTMSSNEPLFVMKDGKKIYDEDSIREIMLEKIKSSNEKSTDQRPTINTVNYGEKKSDLEYEGSVSIYDEKAYRLTILTEEGEKNAYVAHLVEIGSDLFMDLYPIKEYDSKNISDNFFPVHTFYKVKISENEFDMIHFDLEKLNRLFESNLIRLRHENVDGTILITAQPKELQKFIDKYSDDESVFDSTDKFIKI